MKLEVESAPAWRPAESFSVLVRPVGRLARATGLTILFLLTPNFEVSPELCRDDLIRDNHGRVKLS